LRRVEPTESRAAAGLPPWLLIALYCALAVAPLVLGAFALAREEGFWRELSLGVAMVAFALLALQFVLSGRFKRVSVRIGIDLTMRFHQLAARGIAVLIIVHPLLLAFPAVLGDPAAAMRRLGALFAAPSLGSGVAAWVLALVLVTAGIWRRRLPLPYELWRITHGLGAVALIVLTAHHAFRVGLYSGTTPVAILWGLLLTSALGSVVFVYLVRPLILWRRPYRVEAVSQAGRDIWEVVLRPDHRSRFHFDAGQFAWVRFGAYPVPGLDNPFSIASGPSQLPELRFLIKESGDFTRGVGALRPGSKAYLDGPHGNFTLRGHPADRLCLIAGGIGIAPILGILRQLDAEGDPRPITLIWAARTPADLVCREEVDGLAARLNMDVTIILEQPPAGWSGPTGIVDAAATRAAVDARGGGRCLALLCGPTPMMVAAGRLLRDAGVPGRRIVYERFVYD
jgi:predicted ferric reductase